MKSTIYRTRKIRERRQPINTSINAKIKHLQVKLVELSFAKHSNSQLYAQTLEKIHALRETRQDKNSMLIQR